MKKRFVVGLIGASLLQSSPPLWAATSGAAVRATPSGPIAVLAAGVAVITAGALLRILRIRRGR